ncbi:hypothetical protein NIES4072_73920 [Nostoc commune NIES-4072]|uniref:Uncharacterized protein n=1 Tax=Nostoc commune NIES-4072 TaxID=2005467 RepID=A0A2R5FY82_NOSCO|nr:hypothetical protein [Nostoc commune]BBD70959.1 hypothetical protein NIES4070_73700 [Nostoc commune HK-02]GBG23680.1 hypothetical protein NIES4072_73920 [Nostoc commune NIES-4072]
MSKYGDLIKKARETEPENQKAINTSDQTSGLPSQEPELEQMVNLCVKVPISQRRYWMSKAKEQGITVTSVIVEALTQKFGEPESQKARKP